MLFILNIDLSFGNVGLASFASVITSSYKERNCHTVIDNLSANYFANFNLRLFPH
jgi:hypothetical protein